MEPEDILEICLKEIAAGRKTVEECLAAFPDITGLETQLRVVQALRLWSPPTLRPEANQAIEAKLRAAVRSTPRPRPIRQARPLPVFALRRAVAFILILALALGGTGAVAASSDSLPGDLLYPVKRAGESVQVFFTPAPQQASLHILLVKRRLDEIIALAARGAMDASLLADLSTETEAALAAVANAGPDVQSEVLSLLVIVTQQQQDVLEAVKVSATPEAQEGLERAIEASSKHHADAKDRSERASPSGAEATQSAPPTEGGDTPPGQADETEAPVATSTEVPPGHEKKTEEASTPAPDATPEATQEAPPGQTKKTDTPPTSTGSETDPTGSETDPTGCQPNPNAPNPCTPEPTEPPPTSTPEPASQPTETTGPSNSPGGGNPEATSESSGEATPEPEATACPTNPAGQPKCKP